MTTRLILIRHAETEWNREGRMQGFLDSPLTAAGESQGERLRARLASKRLGAVYSSDSGRCRSTATLALAGTGAAPALLKDLRERNLGAWEGRLWADVQREEPDRVTAYRADARFAPPNGETFLDLQRRVFGALEGIVRDHPRGAVAVFTSGAALRSGVMRAVRADPNAWGHWATWNASVTEIEARADRWRLVRYNDTAHLN